MFSILLYILYFFILFIYLSVTLVYIWLYITILYEKMAEVTPPPYALVLIGKALLS